MNHEELKSPIRVLKKNDSDPGNPEFLEVDIPIQPLTFAEVVANFSSLERTHYTREYIAAYHQPFIDSIAHIPEQETVDSVQKERPYYVYLAALIRAYLETFKLLTINRKELEEAEVAYETQKKTIKKYNDKQRFINQWTEVEKPMFSRNVEIEEQKLFSIVELFIKDFFLTKGGIQKFELAATELIDDNPDNLNLIHMLTQAAHQHIELYRKKPQHFDVADLAYKHPSQFSENAVSIVRNGPLADLVFTALKTPVAEQSEEVQVVHQSVQSVAQSLIELYWQRSNYLFAKEETTPLVTLAHEYLLAASVPADEEIFFQAVHEVTEQLIPKHEQFTREVKKVMVGSYEDAVAVDAFLDSINFHISMLSTSEDRQKLVEALLMRGSHQAVIGKSYQAFGFITGMFQLAEKYNWKKTVELFSFRQFAYEPRTVDKITQSAAASVNAVSLASALTDENPHRPVLADVIAGYLPPGTLLKMMYFHQLGQNLPEQKYIQVDDHKRRSVEYIARKRKDEPLTERETFELLHACFLEGAPKTPDERRLLHEHNQPLLTSVTDAYTHFLAHCGDQFHVDQNPMLAQGNLRSVTFRSVYGVSGEYIIELEPNFGVTQDGNTYHLPLILTQSGRIHLAEEKNEFFNIPHYLIETLLATTLPLLHFITSGEYLKYNVKNVLGDSNQPESEQQRDIRTRRPHWMLTPEGTTLKSWGALRHQEEIYEAFGLDIIEENMRRKQAGTLAPSRYITYNKGYLQSQDIPPNQWIFPKGFQSKK